MYRFKFSFIVCKNIKILIAAVLNNIITLIKADIKSELLKHYIKLNVFLCLINETPPMKM